MGNILHTGDMRYYQGMETNIMRVFQQQNAFFKIDEIILDNTYCDPIYKFPQRDKIIDWIIKIIQMRKKEFSKVVLSTYTLGKEELLLALVKFF
jgi:DNA cross-link repair 1B protein